MQISNEVAVINVAFLDQLEICDTALSIEIAIALYNWDSKKRNYSLSRAFLLKYKISMA